MGKRSRRDQASSRPDPARYPRKANPNLAARAGAPATRGDDRPYPERCDPFGIRVPLNDEQRGLATRYLPMAQSLARRYRFRRISESEDLESTAYVALVEAAQSFDPQRTVGFAAFAKHRILGALRDYQRLLLSESWRGNRARRPAFKTLGTEAEQHGRVLGIAPDRPVGTLIDATEAVEHWLRRLPRAHAVACRLIYIDGKSQEEVAAAVGCSRSFLSRLHSEAISWLICDYQIARAGHDREPPETQEAEQTGRGLTDA